MKLLRNCCLISVFILLVLTSAHAEIRTGTIMKLDSDPSVKEVSELMPFELSFKDQDQSGSLETLTYIGSDGWEHAYVKDNPKMRKVMGDPLEHLYNRAKIEVTWLEVYFPSAGVARRIPVVTDVNLLPGQENTTRDSKLISNSKDSIYRLVPINPGVALVMETFRGVEMGGAMTIATDWGSNVPATGGTDCVMIVMGKWEDSKFVVNEHIRYRELDDYHKTAWVCRWIVHQD